jgi:hypothetical protein
MAHTLQSGPERLDGCPQESALQFRVYNMAIFRLSLHADSDVHMDILPTGLSGIRRRVR